MLEEFCRPKGSFQLRGRTAFVRKTRVWLPDVDQQRLLVLFVVFPFPFRLIFAGRRAAAPGGPHHRQGRNVREGSPFRHKRAGKCGSDAVALLLSSLSSLSLELGISPSIVRSLLTLAPLQAENAVVLYVFFAVLAFQFNKAFVDVECPGLSGRSP